MAQDSGKRSVESLLSGFRPGTPLILGAGIVLTLLVVMVGFVAMYQVAYANRVYPGVRALGFELGGYSRDEARAVLQRGLDEIGRRQVTLRYADQSWTLPAHELGLRNDLAPVLDSAFSVGREGNLFGRFWTQFGLLRQGRSFEHPSAAFDPPAQTIVLQRLAQEIDRPAAESRLTITPDFQVDLAAPQASRKLDVEGTRQRLQEALAVPSVNVVDLVVVEQPVQVHPNNLALAREQAGRLLSEPITLSHAGKSWVLDRPQLASILRFDSRLEAPQAAYLDRAALEAWARSLAEAVQQSPQNARFAWAGGRLDVLREPRDGLELDVKATVDAIVAEANGEHREIPLPVAVSKAAVGDEAREALAGAVLIESAKTSYAGSVQAKQENIALAAQRLNGVVVPPGGLFSFNKELGSTSLAAGFKLGWGITTSGNNVKTVPSVAGGICQVATTLFHSVFWSGYQIEARSWHLYWIASYTSKGVVGLDATVDEEAGLDFKFVNPTPHYLLIQSWVDGSMAINFALYGTRPDWRVRVEPSQRTDVVPAEPGLVVDEEPTMPKGQRLQVERATDGFVVANVRRVIREGEEDRVLRLTSRYRPSRNVILVGTGGEPPSGRRVVEGNKPSGDSRSTTPTPVPSRAPATPTKPATNAPATPTAAPTKPPTAPAKPAAATPAPKPAAPTPTPRKQP